MKEEVEVRIYQPGQGRGWGLKVWCSILSELASSYELVWRLFLRNFKAKYRQTLLGFIWALIMPILAVGTFVFLNRAGVLNIGKVDVPYPAYALLGLTIWHVFAGGMRACSNSIVAGGSIVVKINFPKETLVLASLGEALVETLVRLALTVFVFVIYQVVPKWTAVFFPFALIPMILLTLGLGLMLSLLNAVLRDVTNIVSLTSTFLLFLTPVLYPEPKSNFFREISFFNPLATLVSGPRDLVINGSLNQPVLFFIYSGFCLIIFIIAWRFFHLAEIRIPERVGAR